MLAQEVETARREGRMVQTLPLEAVEGRHLVRDRMMVDPEEMTALKASLAARGQQAPIEVVETAPGQYGLISGFRRLMALRDLQKETGEARFASIKAFVRPAASMSDSYLAMVEENEIRTDLSFYERANLACEAARLGIFPDARAAVRALFSAASPARRSKILSFVRLHEALGSHLRFPTAIPERLGLALAGAIERDEAFTRRVRDALRKQPGNATAVEERSLLDRALKRAAGPDSGKAPVHAEDPDPSRAPTKATEEVAIGIRLETAPKRAVLSGDGVTGELLEDLRAWLAQR